MRSSKKVKTPMPCPFCGNEAEIHSSYEDPDHYTVKCMTCYARTGWYTKPESAVRAWNMRPDND